VTLTDPARPAEAMERVRARFPHTLELRFEPAGRVATGSGGYGVRTIGQSDLDLCCGFLEHVRGRPAVEPEVALLREAALAVRLTEAEERGLAVLRARERAAPGRAREATSDGRVAAVLEEAG
jgi:exonuclease SbcD